MHTRLKRIHSIVVASLCATLMSSTLASGMAASDRPDACPGKLGPLKFSSAEVSAADERFPEARCFYRSDDWDKQATIRAYWTSADGPDIELDPGTNKCLVEDDQQVADGQYGEGTRTGRVFPTKGERMVLGTYLATAKGAPTAKIVKAARALAMSYAPLAAACPTPPEALDEEAAAPSASAPVQAEAEAGTETYSDDEIFGGILDVADELASVSSRTFDRETVAACLGVDPGDMSVAIIGESSHADTVMRACGIHVLLLDELPEDEASRVMRVVIALLLADGERRQAEAAE